MAGCGQKGTTKKSGPERLKEPDKNYEPNQRGRLIQNQSHDQPETRLDNLQYRIKRNRL